MLKGWSREVSLGRRPAQNLEEERMQPGGYRKKSSPDRGTKAADLRQEGACDREE